MKLTSSKNFGKTLKDKTDSEYRRLRDNFDLFIEQALCLGMFVPCDLEGSVLEEPKGIKCCGGITNDCDCRGELQYDSEEVYIYQQAKERVLFEGFELVEKREVYDSINGIIIDLDSQTFIIEGSLGIGGGYLIDETIEDLATLDLTLNPTAIKQIGL